jgi:hypothetical protein
MNSDNLDVIVAAYFRNLEKALQPLSAPERQQLMSDIRGHVAEARAGLSEQTELAVREILERVGLPDEIAAEAIDGEAPQVRSRLHHLRRTRPLPSGKSVLRVGVPVAVLVVLAVVLAIVLPSSPPAIELVASSATGATYSVPASSYSVLVTTAKPCFVDIKAPPSEARFAYSGVVKASARPRSFPERGTISVTLGARASALDISASGRSLGAIDHPKLAFTYVFRPST